jgi:hypothetical protein
MNILDEKAAIDVATGKMPVKIIYRDKLAQRLGITPKERLSMALLIKGDRLFVSTLLDGGDLTDAQNAIVHEFLMETGAFIKIIGSIPEKPTTS